MRTALVGTATLTDAVAAQAPAASPGRQATYIRLHQPRGCVVWFLLLAAWLLLASAPLTAQPSSGPLLSRSYDCTVEGAGRAGNNLIVQDPNRYVVTDPLFLLSHPGGVSSFQVVLWFRHLIPSKWPQVLMYELASAGRTGEDALFALASYGVMMADLGDVKYVLSQSNALISLEWVHVSLSWQSGDGGRVNFYVNGVLDSTVEGVMPGWLLPAGGVISLGQRRHAGGQFGFIDDFGVFAAPAPLDPADLRALMSGNGAAEPLSATLGGILTRGQAELFWSFNQPLHLDSDSSAEVIVDDSSNGHVGHVVCTRHCRSGILVPARLPGVTTTDALTVLLPVTGVETEHLLYLARLPPPGSSSASSYVSESLTIDALPSDASLATLYRVGGGANGSVDASKNFDPPPPPPPQGDPPPPSQLLVEGDEVQSSQMNATITAAGFLAVILRISAAFNMDSQFSMRYTVQPVDPDSPPFSTVLTFVANHPPTPAPPDGYLDPPSVSPSPASMVQMRDVDEGASIEFFVLWQRLVDGGGARQWFAADPDGDDVEVWLVGLPHAGQLYHSSADMAAGRPIASASLSSPVRVLNTSFTLVYAAPVVREGSFGTDPAGWPNVSLLFSDGKQLAADLSVIRFDVRPLVQLPAPQPLNVTLNQSSLTLLTLPVDRSVLAENDAPHLVITSLPAGGGALFQVAPDGSVGSMIGQRSSSSNAPASNGRPGGRGGVGGGRKDPFSAVSSIAAPKSNSSARFLVGADDVGQWLSEVVAWSSSWPDPGDAWNVSQILGPPDVFPRGGDNPKAWAGNHARSAEWVEARIEQPVFISGIEIYETFNPGHVQSILAREPQSGHWQLIWYNPSILTDQVEPVRKSRVSSPTLCPMTFATRALRIELAPVGTSWAEIDAVRIFGRPVTRLLPLQPQHGNTGTGTTAADLWAGAPPPLPSNVVLDPQGRVWFESPELARGEVHFTFTLNSCRFFSVYRHVGVRSTTVTANLLPINHPSVVSPSSVDTDPHGAVLLAVGEGLAAYDPDGGELRIEVLSLPARGKLWLVHGTRAAGSSPSSASSSSWASDPSDGLEEPPPGARLISALDLPFLAPLGSALLFLNDVPCHVEQDGDFVPVEMRFNVVDAEGVRSDAADGLSGVVTIHIYCWHVIPVPPALFNAAVAVFSVGVLACVLCGCVMWSYRVEPVIAASSPLWHLVGLLGVIFMYWQLLPTVWSPLSRTVCWLRLATYLGGNSLLYCPMLAKSWRVHRILRNKSLSRDGRVSDRDLAKLVGGWMLYICAVLVASFYYVREDEVYSFSTNAAHDVRMGCPVLPAWFRGLLIGSVYLLLTALSVLCFLIRSAPPAYGDTSNIVFCVFVAVVGTLLGSILDLFVVFNPETAMQRVILISIVSTTILVRLFLLKLLALARVLHDKRANPSREVEALRQKLKRRFAEAALARGLNKEQAAEEAKEMLDKCIKAAMREQQEQQQHQHQQRQKQHHSDDEAAPPADVAVAAAFPLSASVLPPPEVDGAPSPRIPGHLLLTPPRGSTAELAHLIYYPAGATAAGKPGSREAVAARDCAMSPEQSPSPTRSAEAEAVVAGVAAALHIRLPSPAMSAIFSPQQDELQQQQQQSHHLQDKLPETVTAAGSAAALPSSASGSPSLPRPPNSTSGGLSPRTSPAASPSASPCWPATPAGAGAVGGGDGDGDEIKYPQQHHQHHDAHTTTTTSPMMDVTRMTLAQLKALTPQQLLRWQTEYNRARSACASPSVSHHHHHRRDPSLPHSSRTTSRELSPATANASATIRAPSQFVFSPITSVASTTAAFASPSWLRPTMQSQLPLPAGISAQSTPPLGSIPASPSSSNNKQPPPRQQQQDLGDGGATIAPAPSQQQAAAVSSPSAASAIKTVTASADSTAQLNPTSLCLSPPLSPPS